MAETSHKRPHQVAHLLQQELGLLLTRGVKDPRIGFVTITDVHLPNDLRQATVYVSFLGEEAAQQKSLQGLQAATGYLRRELGRTLNMRYCPELRFVADSTLEHARRVEALLAAAQGGATEPPPVLQSVGLPTPHTGREMPPPEAFAPPAAVKPARSARRRPTLRRKKGTAR